MGQAARALLAQIVDYAGLFPPARLPLEEAVATYARHRESNDSWMLSRFIVPAARIGELAEHRGVLVGTQGAYELSLLSGGGRDAASLIDVIGADLRRVAAFERAHAGAARAGAFELRAPESDAGLDDVARRVSGVVSDALGRAVPAFFETPQGEDFSERSRRTIDLVARAVRGAAAPLGIKLRCGGLEADAFPSVELVTRTLLACRDAGLPFKATAGLHHPVRGVAGPGGAVMHGFLNVFGGGALAIRHGLDEDGLRPIVEERDASAFGLDNGSFRWRELSVDAAELAVVRRDRLISFGSCSFDEPRDDLAELGFLAPTREKEDA